MDPECFQLPIAFDLAATFFFALTGALAGIRRGYDVVGVLGLALLTGGGGSVIRCNWKTRGFYPPPAE